MLKFYLSITEIFRLIKILRYTPVVEIPFVKRLLTSIIKRPINHFFHRCFENFE